MYQGIQDRSEQDTMRKDPFSDKFRILFNYYSTFQPDIPMAYYGVTEDILKNLTSK